MIKYLQYKKIIQNDLWKILWKFIDIIYYSNLWCLLCLLFNFLTASFRSFLWNQIVVNQNPDSLFSFSLSKDGTCPVFIIVIYCIWIQSLCIYTSYLQNLSFHTIYFVHLIYFYFYLFCLNHYFVEFIMLRLDFFNLFRFLVE